MSDAEKVPLLVIVIVNHEWAKKYEEGGCENAWGKITKSNVPAGTLPTIKQKR